MLRTRDVSRKSGREPTGHGPNDGGPLLTLIHEYIEDLEIRGRAAVTAEHYHRYLGTFVEWLAATCGKAADAVRLSDVDPECIRQFRLFLARRRDPRDGRVIATPTRNLYQIALRNFLRYCRRRRGLEAPDPDEHIELAKERDIPVRRLERSEVERLGRAVDLEKPTGLRDRAIIEMLFGTGCRVSELVALTRRQVDLVRREAEVIGKGGKSRLVLLTEDAAHWARRYVETRSDESPWLFISRQRDRDGKRRPLTTRQVQNVVERAAHRAGIPFRVSPHWFRHSRLQILAAISGVHVAQRIAGHQSLSTTSRYLSVSDSTLRKLFDEAEHAGRERGPAEDH